MTAWAQSLRMRLIYFHLGDDSVFRAVSFDEVSQ
jgi:hypothetical protein